MIQYKVKVIDCGNSAKKLGQVIDICESAWDTECVGAKAQEPMACECDKSDKALSDDIAKLFEYKHNGWLARCLRSLIS